MNKKTIRIAGWALGLSMAVTGIGAAVSALGPENSGEPMMVNAADGASVGDIITSFDKIRDGYSYKIVYNLSSTDYYLTTSITSNKGSVSSTAGDAGVFLFESTGNDNEWNVSFMDSTTKTYIRPNNSNATVTTNTSSTGMAVTAETISSKIGLYKSFSGTKWYFAANASNKTCGGYRSTSSQQYISKMIVVSTGTVSPTSVSLNKTVTSIEVGETETLTATVLPGDATNKNVTWSSSNEAVATVENGVVSALTAGNTTITATTVDGGLQATCVVTVTGSAVSVTGVSLNKTETSLYIGDTETLTATIAPANATTKTVSWSSSDSSVATVENGVVTAVEKGSATITVTTLDGNHTATCAVTVNNVPVSSVTINKTSTTLYLGESETLTATVAPAEGTVQTVTWSSSDTSVATVSGGKITTRSFGTTSITARSTDDGTKYGECIVTVMKPVVLNVNKNDTLDQELTGVKAGTTSYTSWSGKSSAGANKSTAVYAGKSAASHGIQLRTSGGDEGIVTTTSGGYAKRAVVTWDINTANDRILQIWGKNTSYESAEDLYDPEGQGFLLGTTKYNGEDTEVTITLSRPCQYIGIKSSSGALYLDSVQIDWGSTVASYDDIAAVDAFIDSNMHLDHTSNDGSCKSWYGGMKSAFNGLSVNQKAILLQGDAVYKMISETEWTYSDVMDRILAWADANGDKLGNDNSLTQKSGLALNSGLNLSDSNLPLIITLVSGGVLLAGGAFLFARRRKNED